MHSLSVFKGSHLHFMFSLCTWTQVIACSICRDWINRQLNCVLIVKVRKGIFEATRIVFCCNLFIIIYLIVFKRVAIKFFNNKMLNKVLITTRWQYSIKHSIVSQVLIIIYESDYLFLNFYFMTINIFSSRVHDRELSLTSSTISVLNILIDMLCTR